ncbi:MAG: glycerophosphoryl diester phosphodiesterase membrane domain-containing protein [Novosphingobium sp.]
MNFDSNRAWQDAMASAKACQSLLLPIAGVFFLIPAVASSFFLGDLQARMLENLANREVLNGIVEAEAGKIITISLLTMVAGFIGYLSVLVLLTDRSRPTVGQAIMRGVRYLPTMLGATIIGYIALIVFTVLIGVVGGILAAIIGGAGVALIVVAIMVLLTGGAVRFSMTMPVIVAENELNPVTALKRSWQLTRGNAFKLLGFYALLFIAYVVITVILMIVIGAISGLAGGSEPGQATLIFTGVISGAIVAVVGVIASAVLAAVHAQLAGVNDASFGETFG